ncbi:MAG: mechanosensitive ion channel family protein, partial [Pseudomonadaceae bacterium]
MKWDVLLDETLWVNIAIVAAITVVSYVLLRAILKLVTNRLKRLLNGSRSGFSGIAAQMLENTSSLLILAFSLLIGLKVVDLPERWESAMSHGWFVALA